MTLGTIEMTKRDHLDDSVQPPTKSAPGLTAEQVDALVKVYRYLLALHKKHASGAVSKHPASVSSASQIDSRSHASAAPSDE